MGAKGAVCAATVEGEVVEVNAGVSFGTEVEVVTDGSCTSVVGSAAVGAASTTSAVEAGAGYGAGAGVDVGGEAGAGAGGATEVRSEESSRLWTWSSSAILFLIRIFYGALKVR